jgi:uncharacterized membrane protein required for colicin V production
MNWFDIFVLILLLRTSYIGFKSGLATEVYKAAGLVLSGLAAFYFYKRLIWWMSQYTITYISDKQLQAVAFVGILVLGLLVCKFVFMFVQKLMELSFAKNFSTTMGMISGLIRGVVIACLTFIILNWSAVDYIKDSLQEKSFSGSYIVQINNQARIILTKLLPAENY